jgi:hypothetical protein
MKTLDKALTASVFSLGNGGSFADEALLPADALVIVIQDRPDARGAPPLLQWDHHHLPETESLPVVRRRAEKAYSEWVHSSIFGMNVSG